MDYTKIKNLISSVLEESVKVSDSSKEHYKFSVGHLPRGTGSWLFSTVHPVKHTVLKHDVFHHNGSYGEAVKAAASHYKDLGHTNEIHVLS